METIAPPGSAAVASHSPEARGASSNTQHPSSKTNLGKVACGSHPINANRFVL